MDYISGNANEVIIFTQVNDKLTTMIKEIESVERKITPKNFNEMKSAFRD